MLRLLLIVGGGLLMVGCRTASAPIHVWHAAHWPEAQNNRVVLLGIDGPDAIASPLESELRSRSKLALVSVDQLQSSGGSALPHSAIRLVSTFDETPSDMNVAAMARAAGIDWMLRGEVLQSTGRDDSDQTLRVFWRLTDLTGQHPGGGVPIVVDLNEIAQRHPVLNVISDPGARLRRAAVLETEGLLRPRVAREQVELAHPRLLGGSKAVRAANAMAARGDWPAAETAWSAVLEKHPRQPAAWINLAVAAAARQDFDAAHERITEALRNSVMSPTHARWARQTLLWLELRRREYHQAFDMPVVNHDRPSILAPTPP